MNRQTELTFGYARDELIGQPVEVLVPRDLRARHKGQRQHGGSLVVYSEPGNGTTFTFTLPHRGTS